MICKTILSFLASIIKLFIILLLITKTLAYAIAGETFSNDNGVLSVMYHRFNENKYPSTNIDMDIFKKHIQIIKDQNFKFINLEDFKENFDIRKDEKKILLTVDDGFKSFYDNAWPFLKENKIPFILFISTEPVGKTGYMNWEQIKEIEKENFAYIGNHSHSHEYLINYEFDKFKKDIDKSINIFQDKIGYNPIYFSYPFGEYSLEQKLYIKKNFEFAFGQNSGVIDLNKDKFELPRFPINEKYGDIERFDFLIKLKPLEYKKISIKDNLILPENNPPNLKITFFNNQNVNGITCFSNEGEDWHQTKTELEGNVLKFFFKEKFKFRRGRVNCSLNQDGWRWMGLQFSIKTN